MRTLAALSILSATLGLVLPSVRACPGDGKINVTVIVILATEEGSKVDPKLKEFAKEVQVKYPQLTSFTIKTMVKKSLAADEKSTFKLVDKETAQIIVKHCADKKNRVSLAVTAPDQGEITYRTVCGKYLPIVTRYQTKAKERLILAIQVEPCND